MGYNNNVCTRTRNSICDTQVVLDNEGHIKMQQFTNTASIFQINIFVACTNSVCVCVCVRVCVCACVRACACVCVHAYMGVCVCNRIHANCQCSKAFVSDPSMAWYTVSFTRKQCHVCYTHKNTNILFFSTCLFKAGKKFHFTA